MLGVFISACLHQRGARIRETALSIAKQTAVLMIQHFSDYAFAPNVEQLILERKANDRVDPLILFHCFDSVYRGDQTNLAKARKTCGLDKITDSRVLPVPCLEHLQFQVWVYGFVLKVNQRTSPTQIIHHPCKFPSAFSSNQAWVAAYMHRLRNDLANLNYYEAGIGGFRLEC